MKLRICGLLAIAGFAAAIKNRSYVAQLPSGPAASLRARFAGLRVPAGCWSPAPDPCAGGVHLPSKILPSGAAYLPVNTVLLLFHDPDQATSFSFRLLVP